MARTSWRKACSRTACVETAREGDVILIRDSKDPDGPHLTFDLAEFAAFLDGARTGVFDDLVGETG